MAAIDPRWTGGIRRGRDRTLDQSGELDLCADRKAGMKLWQLTEKYGLSKPSIYAVLERHGLHPKQLVAETKKPTVTAVGESQLPEGTLRPQSSSVPPGAQEYATPQKKGA